MLIFYKEQIRYDSNFFSPGLRDATVNTAGLIFSLKGNFNPRTVLPIYNIGSKIKKIVPSCCPNETNNSVVFFDLLFNVTTN